MQSKTDVVGRAQTTPRKFKGLKMVLGMGLVMGGALLLTPTQQAEAGGCYSGFGYGGYGYRSPGFGYYNSYPSYRSGFSYSSPSFGIGIYSGGRSYYGGSYYGRSRSGYRSGYGYGGHRGHGHHGHRGHRGHGSHGGHGRRR